MKKGFLSIAVALVLVMGMAGLSFGGVIDWANWTTTSGPDTVDGAGASYTVSYNGELNFAQINNTGTIYYYTDPSHFPVGAPYTSTTVSNLPPTSDIIAIVGDGTTHTITFTGPVTNPVMAIVSLGQPSLHTSYNFDQPFTILSDGPGWWGSPGTLLNPSGNVLQGIEGDGTIQFIGTYSTITWTGSNGEVWNGFTVGVPVPVPPTALLLGSGLLGLGLLRFRRKA